MRTPDRPKPLYHPNDDALTCLSDRAPALFHELIRRGYTPVPTIQPTEYARLHRGTEHAVIVDARVADVDMTTIRVVVAEPRGQL
jgi:hypothetical protein